MKARIRLVGWHRGQQARGTWWLAKRQRYRVQAMTEIRLAGRHRWLKQGGTALVPKHAVTVLETPTQEAPMT